MNQNMNDIIYKQWENQFDAAQEQALAHYDGMELLLDMLCSTLLPYLQVPRMAQIWEISGLRPAHMLDVSHPAYLADAMAMRCLQSYDPEEADEVALQRCIVDLLDRNAKLMAAADLSEVEFDGRCWEQYPLDSMLRLIWRHRGSPCLEIPFYLEKGAKGLRDPFLIQVQGNRLAFIQCIRNRFYEVHVENMDYEAFCQSIFQCFRLATEDYGYFVPKYLWLSPAKNKKEETYA